MAENIDINQRIVDENGYATPYFETLWYQLLNAIGGEGDNLIQQLLSEANMPVIPGIATIKDRINDIERQANKKQNLSTITNSLESLQKQVNINAVRAAKLEALSARVEQLEKTAISKQNLHTLKQDIEDLRWQLNL